ncbi:B- and T-lymphocyte attenuator [Epinephelus fuscoguttatus]|uniref:B- and T-lymphocyte attenuator n=1 Tax=Epinephelus fuscoguttatus TaxID=293821 RepID=UPI0020D0C514|nr:B- and T-lymphocyte attenuator [Epinephelus fuscoguttatus]
MNTSSVMDRLMHTSLLIFCFFTFVCINGRGQGSPLSCEVKIMVQQGTTWKTGPQQNVTISCPVKHCGESPRVTWCKLLDAYKCKRISNPSENVEIRQTDVHGKDELISYLTFTRISIRDDGLYRCYLKGPKYEEVSHTINVSVSDLNQGTEYSDNNAGLSHLAKNNADKLSGAGHESALWLPYFYICVCIALVVLTLTVLTFLSFYGWKRIGTYNLTKRQVSQEMSTHVIPDLPKGNAPLSLVLCDTYSPRTEERPPLQPPQMTTGIQHGLGNTADGSQVSDSAVYAIINHQQLGRTAREHHAATKQNKKAEYATINAS